MLLLPLGLAGASPIPARAIRGTLAEAHTRYRWHTSCADVGLHRAGAPAERLWEAAVGHERDPWSQILTREMNASPSSLWSSRMSWWRAHTGLTTVPGVSS